MKIRSDRQWRWLVALGGVLVPGIVFGAFSVPHQFEAGTPIKASEMNANFEAIAAELDARTNPPAAPVVGSVTLAGVAGTLPIARFSQSITVPWTIGTAPGKPSFSEVTLLRPAGSGTPDMNRTLVTGKSLTTASIALGNLTITLTDVRVTSVSVVDARGALPQEAIGLLFRAISWDWEDGENPRASVTFNLETAATTGSPVDSFAFGYFPAGLTPDATYAPIAGYKHQLGCVTPASGCKAIHGPVVVSKSVSSSTLGAISAAVSARPVAVTLDWFADDASVNNGIALEESLVTSFAITTAEDGTLSESVSFSYPKIYWTAGITEAGWNVAQNTPL